MNAPARKDLHQAVTDTIVSQLETGVAPWQRPWSADNTTGRIALPLRHTGQPYKGINTLLLWSSGLSSGYSSPYWMTYKQAQDYSGQVRKGEKSSPVTYSDKIRREQEKPDGTLEDRDIWFLKEYRVFNADQIDGLPPRFRVVSTEPTSAIERIEQAEEFFCNLKADIRYGGNRAYYSMASDHIQMPPFESFTDGIAAYGTLAHEGVHWTRHPSRLNRDFGQKRFGDPAYAGEEIVAELGASYVCAALGLEPQPQPQPREEHAAYIQSWLKAMKEDKKFIFTAASHAQKAADYMHGLQPQSAIAPGEPEPEEAPPAAGFAAREEQRRAGTHRGQPRRGR